MGNGQLLADGVEYKVIILFLTFFDEWKMCGGCVEKYFNWHVFDVGDSFLETRDDNFQLTFRTNLLLTPIMWWE